MTPRQVGLLAALAAIWGGSYLLIKYCLEGFSAPVIVFGRTLLGVLVLLAVIRLQGGAQWAALSDARRRPLHALGRFPMRRASSPCSRRTAAPSVTRRGRNGESCKSESSSRT